MTNHNKNNGSRYEREFVALCQDAGLVAQRVPLSGAMKNYPGDVIVSDELTIEVKYRKGGAGFKRLMDWSDSAHRTQGCIQVGRLLVMPIEWWIDVELARINDGDTSLTFEARDSKSEWAFVNAAFDQGESVADYVACRMPRRGWIVIKRLSRDAFSEWLENACLAIGDLRGLK